MTKSGKSNSHIYFVLDPESSDVNALVTDIPKELPRPYRFHKGVSLASECTSVRFKYAKDYKERITLTDFVDNTISLLIVSGKMASVIRKFSGPDVEFIPASIANHKGMISGVGYYVVNFTSLTECVDIPTSKLEFSEAFPGQVASFTQITLLPSLCENGPPILRMKEKTEVILVREDLKMALESAEISGVNFTVVSRYRSP